MTTRRAFGEGSVFQRKDGRWQASIQVEGTRRTVYGKTRREAMRRLADLQRHAVVGGQLANPGRRTVGDLLDAWLEAVRPNLKPATAAHYELLATTYLRPTLAAVKLSKLTPRRVQTLCTTLQAKGHNRTAQLAHFALKQACALAVSWRWLAENPCEHVRRPQYQARRRGVWGTQELATFQQGAGTHWLHPLWMLAITTGCRPGELLGLGWADVDLGRRTVTIRHSLQRVKGSYILGHPKTAAGERAITLSTEGIRALRRQRAQQAEWRLRAGATWADSWGLVFSGKTGWPLHRAVIAHALQRVCTRLGLPALSPHGLRHLHASLLLAEGLPLPAVSARLGHAHSGVTASVYAHTLAGQDDAAAEVIAKALGGGR